MGVLRPPVVWIVHTITVSPIISPPPSSFDQIVYYYHHFSNDYDVQFAEWSESATRGRRRWTFVKSRYETNAIIIQSIWKIPQSSPGLAWRPILLHLYYISEENTTFFSWSCDNNKGGRVEMGGINIFRVIVDCNLLMLLIPSKFLCWLVFDSECGFCFVYGCHGDLPPPSPTHHSTTLQCFLSITAGGRIKIGREAGDGGP